MGEIERTKSRASTKLASVRKVKARNDAANYQPTAQFFDAIAELAEAPDPSGIETAISRVSDAIPGYNEMEAARRMVAAAAASAQERYQLATQLKSALEQSRRLLDVSIMFNASRDLQELLMHIRNAAVEVCGFDRAGVFLCDLRGGMLHGTWGTDREGRLEDIRDNKYPLDSEAYELWSLASDIPYILVKNFTEENGISPADVMFGVRMQATMPMVANGETIGIICLDNLLTDRDVTEEDLQRLLPFAHLGAAAVHRARMMDDLLRARDEALAATRAKSEFLANMSHEIRTPMNGLMGMAELLMETSLSSQQGEYASIISRSAESLLTVINDILDFSKIEAGKMTIEAAEFNLRDAVEEVGELLAAQAHEKGLELACAFDPNLSENLVGDQGRLRQVLTNLVGNAIKFTNRGEVAIEASLIQESASHVSFRLAVRDTGIGIRPERQQAIFDSFTQADSSTTRQFGGTGLGLTICRQLVQLMNGRVGMSSKLGEGSVFWLELDIPKQAGVPLQPPMPGSLQGKRALVVDDNQTNRRIFCEHLKSWGCVPSEAKSGKTAIELASTHSFEFVIMDLHMPEMDGNEATKRIRALSGYNQVPIVLLTSHCAKTTQEERLYDAVLIKPARQAVLLETLLRVTGAARTRNEPRRPASTRLGELPAARVLVAEDNLVNRKILSHMLGRSGCQVTLTANGLEAIEAFGNQDYDLILMDVQMPILDGFEAVPRIRAIEKTKGNRTPIIAITAHAMEGDRDRCLQAGMDDYLTKPVKAEALFAMIAKWAGGANNLSKAA